jgi:hypothetical protein
MGWQELKNGPLIAAAERDGFPVMVTTDKNLQYQQNLSGRKVSIIVLAPILVFYEDLVPLVGQLIHALDDLSEGSFIVIKPEG